MSDLNSQAYDSLLNDSKEYNDSDPKEKQNELSHSNITTDEFKLENIEGDFYLMHLYMILDLGIKIKVASKETETARYYKKWHDRLKPLMYFTLFVYITGTHFERPAWCEIKVHEKDFGT
jgi:hypothetical protein